VVLVLDDIGGGGGGGVSTVVEVGGGLSCTETLHPASAKKASGSRKAYRMEIVPFVVRTGTGIANARRHPDEAPSEDGHYASAKRERHKRKPLIGARVPSRSRALDPCFSVKLPAHGRRNESYQLAGIPTLWLYCSFMVGPRAKTEDRLRRAMTG